MQAEPRSRALFVFVGKRCHTMKVLTWDGTGAVVIHKKLDAGRFELPRPTCVGERAFSLEAQVIVNRSGEVSTSELPSRLVEQDLPVPETSGNVGSWNYL